MADQDIAQQLKDVADKIKQAEEMWKQAVPGEKQGLLSYLTALQNKEVLLMQQQQSAAPTSAGLADAEATIKKRLPAASKYAAYIVCSNGSKEAAVVVAPHHVTTYAHDNHSCWEIGHEVKVAVHDESWDHPRIILAKVDEKDEQADLVLLKTQEELPTPSLDARLDPGDRYFVLGQSTQPQSDAMSVSHGMISATKLDACSHVRGDMMAGCGDSGAGCFLVDNGALIGMVVGTRADAHKALLLPAAIISSKIKAS